MSQTNPRNIEVFDKITGHILVKLYESFPVPLNIEQEEVFKEVSKNCTDADFVSKIYLEIIPSTFNFLYDEKFIDYDQMSNTITPVNCFYTVTLTLKGFSLLRTIPTSINDNLQSTYFERLKNSISQEGTKTAVSETVKFMFNSAVIGISEAFKQ